MMLTTVCNFTIYQNFKISNKKCINNLSNTKYLHSSFKEIHFVVDDLFFANEFSLKKGRRARKRDYQKSENLG